MASYEPSEIMFAAAMMYSNRDLDDYSKNINNLRAMMIDAREKLNSSSSIVKFGSTTIRDGFLSYMDEKDVTLLADLAGGISAAKGLRSEVGDFIPKAIYMTGDVWPSEVEKFKVSAYGFKDYNSADVIVSPKPKVFYGISLKKKRKPSAGEPTLINKAFDTLLQGDEFKEVKQKLIDSRISYFASIIREAVKLGIINKDDIKDYSRLSDKELFEAKNRNKELFGDYAYIDTKGWYGAPERKGKAGYLNDDTTNKNSMRYFVNKKLANPDNELWKSYINIMNEYADAFADTLITIILKNKLFDELDAKAISDKEFQFFLVTGVGDVTKSKLEVSVDKATVIPLKTTLCGLTRIEKKFASSKYQVVINTTKKSQADAAKIFLQLKRGTVTLLDLEIRYKGSFTPQPQFQGTLNDQFKQLLVKECGMS